MFQMFLSLSVCVCVVAVQFPTYGSCGLNTGVLVMNLTRMREFEGGWTENIMQVVHKYKKKMILADQDILNILFSNKVSSRYRTLPLIPLLLPLVLRLLLPLAL